MRHADPDVLTIEAKALGQRRALIPAWQIPLPPAVPARGEPFTLRTLITRIVGQEVAAFADRQDRRRLVQVLTASQIEGGVMRGRVDPGGRELHQTVRPEEAIGTALQAFEDGLYIVLIDGREYRDLDEQISPGPDSVVTFLRLVMLAGA